MDRGSAAVSLTAHPRQGSRAAFLLWLIPLAFLGLFYFYPLATILQVSFARGEAGLAAPIRAMLTSEIARRAVWFTIYQASLSTFFTLLLGLPGAYIFAHHDFRGKRLLQSLSGIPFVLPTLVVAAAFNALLGPKGLVNQLLMNALQLSAPPISFAYTFSAIIIAHVFYNTTIVLRLVGDFWSHLDPRLSQTATMLGANRWKVFWHVTFPLLLPAILAAALLVFIFDFTSFGVILVLGGPRFATIEVEIFYQTVSLFNLPMAATLSVFQLACTLGLTVSYSFLSNRLSRPLSLRPRRFTQHSVRRFGERLLIALYLVGLFSLLLAPLGALVLRSFLAISASGEEMRFTLDYYRELNISRRESLFFVPPMVAILVSLSYASATVFLSLLLGLPAALALRRASGSKLSRLLDGLIMLPLGTSAVTMGLGFILALDKPPLDLRASPLLIPLAHTLVALPFVVRSLVPALRSIRPRLRQAAAMLGADPRQTVLHVDLPLIGRALLVAATFAFTISLGEFGATALIARPEYPTIPIMIYRFISQPGALNYGQALALSTILMAVTALGMLSIERFRLAEIGEF